jgi:hypothetical protein
MTVDHSRIVITALATQLRLDSHIIYTDEPENLSIPPATAPRALHQREISPFNREVQRTHEVLSSILSSKADLQCQDSDHTGVRECSGDARKNGSEVQTVLLGKPFCVQPRANTGAGAEVADTDQKGPTK